MFCLGTLYLYTGSGNTAVLHMRNEKYAIQPLFVAELPKFPRLKELGSRNAMMMSDLKAQV